MPKKIQDCTMAHLISVPLPNHAASYTVISHQLVIDYSKQQLAAAGFDIVDEEYRCTADGQIAQGVYKLNYQADEELSMMFAWTNSYNKQVKFKCLIGGYINQSRTVMTSGEIGTWTRKRMGTADTETKDTIDTQITNAHMYYKQLLSDKNLMKDIHMSKRKQAQMLGILFAEYQILTTEQASMIRQQMVKPMAMLNHTHTLWGFYNYVTMALQLSHPRTWMEDQRILHMFISDINKLNQVPTPVVEEVVEEEVVDPLYVIPNQTNILDQLADLEADQIDEDIRYAENDDNEGPFDTGEDYEDTDMNDNGTINYTDPVGNTFEVPMVPPCAAHDAETEKEEFLSLEPTIEANLDLIEEIEDDSFDLDLGFGVSDDDEDSSNVPDFF